LEPLVLRGNHSKATKLLGWAPKINFEETVRRMVEADVERLKDLKTTED